MCLREMERENQRKDDYDIILFRLGDASRTSDGYGIRVAKVNIICIYSIYTRRDCFYGPRRNS